MATKSNNSGVKKAAAAVAAKSPAVNKESSPPNSPAVKAATVKSASAKPAPAKPVAAKPAAAKPVAAKAAAPVAATPPAKAEAVKPVAVVSDAPGKAKKEGKKPKLVRDSFTLPESDYALFASMKARCLAKGVEVKKSELLRAALRQLSGLDDPMLIAVMAQVERIKTGRPAG